MGRAACRASVVRGCPKTRHSMGNGRKMCALPGKPPNQVPRAARWKNEGPMMLVPGRIGGIGFRPIYRFKWLPPVPPTPETNTLA